ncbi:cell division ATPase FtsA [Clostridium saccharobutylicum]|uniref:cell division protein FtsA n=1 Tax=Clostridium saccharobutylicum TaxID=169679 RepID=UPI001F4BE838|nr:cell division protein FtsA [Clostridium saccharobutylicum]NSA17488.1 cell division ATPase FtsA [Clostridium saccharobutylicum]
MNDKNAMGEIALVDIGAGVVDIALFSGNIIKNISNISVGGNNISNDLAICGGFSFLEADNIKKYMQEIVNLYLQIILYRIRLELEL